MILFDLSENQKEEFIMAQSEQEASPDKLSITMSLLFHSFSALQAQEDGGPDFMQAATSGEIPKLVAEEYGITTSEVCRLITEIAPEAAANPGEDETPNMLGFLRSFL